MWNLNLIMEINQGHGFKIVIPDEDPYKKLESYLLILWKCGFDSTDIIDFCETTLESFDA